MSWFDSFIEGAEDAKEYVFDQETYQTRKLLRTLAPLIVAAARRNQGWYCRKCNHDNGEPAKFCGGCGRKRGSPL